MKLAYLILAHKQFDLLARIIKFLNHPDIDIFIHIDKKAGIDLDQFNEKLENDNVYFLDRRIEVHWGGFSILYVQMMLLSSSVTLNKYDYISFISGQDYPIKTNEYILEFLRTHNGREFFEFSKLPNPDWMGNGGKHRYEYYWLVDELGYDRSAVFYRQQLADDSKVRNIPGGLIPYGGSNWFTITKSCANYVYSFIKDNPYFVHFFKMVVHPEEIFFHTIILNSVFGQNCTNNNLRFIDWKSPGPKPKLLTGEDLNRLMPSEYHFARKFDLLVDSTVIDLIETGLITQK